VKLGNIVPMLVAGLDNIPLTKYLIDQLLQSPEDRMVALREFVPRARPEDWELEVAGQRVQVIKQDDERGGVLEFGTEVVNAADGSLAALLGASPGASTAVSIMLTLLERCFPAQMASAAWQERLRQLIPSFGRSLANEPALVDEVRAFSGVQLGLAHG
jgi:malate dehydrogenase (quinone)